MRRRRFLAADLSIVAAVAVVIVTLSALTGRSGPQRGIPIPSFADARSIPAGFVGVSLEYPALEHYAGTDPSAIDPLLVRLIANLAPGQRPVLRVGGDSTDHTWYPVAGEAAPAGVSFTIDQQWLAVTRALAAALRARLILGLDLEADDRQLAAVQARSLLDGLGRGSVRALELGNEPELYGGFTWYRTSDGSPVLGRPKGYDFAAFARDFSQFAQALPSFPLAGPAIGGPGWLPYLERFVAGAPRLGLVTVHRYPLQKCFVPQGSPRYPTIANLLSSQASAGLASSLAPAALVSHRRGLPLRIDEINSVSCGADRAVSESFASALWVADAMFELAYAGIDGVNLHTFPGAGYELFKVSDAGGRWRAAVGAEYYGLLLFAQAAPAGARLLRLSRAAAPLRIWATRAGDGTLRIALINKDARRAHSTLLRIAGAQGPVMVERLQAASATARSGVSLGGQSFGAETETGTLPAPSETELRGAGDAYTVALAPASAALLTVPARRG